MLVLHASQLLFDLSKTLVGTLRSAHTLNQRQIFPDRLDWRRCARRSKLFEFNEHVVKSYWIAATELGAIAPDSDWSR
ncbi:hypothetical protein ASD03_27385 [Ensifer sp. Root127]|nr:hypothetical protein ASD03_27385 [Ensifer sp. Root127]